MLVAAGGLLLPLLLGVALAWVFVPASPVRLAQAIFLGTAVAITAVPVAIKILMDLGKLDSPIGKTIVAAALVDDILSLILLSVLTALIRTGDMISLEQQALLVGKVVVFLACTSAVGVWVLPRLAKLVTRLESIEVELSLLVVVGLAFAVFAEAMGMHFIIGAFLAGLFFSARTLSNETYEEVSSQVSGLTNGLLAPIFFASIGLHLELDVVVEAPLFVAALLLVAIVGKIVGSGGAALARGFAPRASLAIGAAMSARGAVELIVADVAMRGGLFDRPDPPPPIVEQMFSAVVLMAIVTTLLAPIALRVILRDARGDGD
jgi:Kef-type K+ transport system membrane component KefB